MAATAYLMKGLDVYRLLHPEVGEAALMIGAVDAVIVMVAMVDAAKRKALLDATVEYMQMMMEKMEDSGMLAEVEQAENALPAGVSKELSDLLAKMMKGAK